MLDFDYVETPESVYLERRLAGIGSRFIAGLVDCLLILLVLLLLWLVVFLVAWGVVTSAYRAVLGEGLLVMVAIAIILTFLLIWGYFLFFESITNGQSPGKRSVGIRVVKADGGPVTFWDLAVRNFLRIVDFLPAFYFVAGLVMFVTKRCQRLGDLAAGTVVVSEARASYSAKGSPKRGEQVAQMGGVAHSPETKDLLRQVGYPVQDSQGPVQWPGTTGRLAASLRASRLRSEECAVLDNYMSRLADLSVEARARVLPQLLAPILRRLGEAPRDAALATLEAWVSFELNRSSPEEPNPWSAAAQGGEAGAAP